MKDTYTKEELRKKIYNIIFDIDLGFYTELDKKRSEAATEIEKLVLKLLEEQKRICSQHAKVWEGGGSCRECGSNTVDESSILSAPLATGETNYVVIEKEKFEEMKAELEKLRTFYELN